MSKEYEMKDDKRPENAIKTTGKTTGEITAENAAGPLTGKRSPEARRALAEAEAMTARRAARCERRQRVPGDKKAKGVSTRDYPTVDGLRASEIVSRMSKCLPLI